ncbi:MAG: nucleotidyltransferase family protein [Gemmataceae bacterium]|nr:nucleotidyltransferase family protein [Gemmataceae bacterium]
MKLIAGRLPQRISDIPALILAGGLGTRLRDAVPQGQKVLAPVRQRPFLTRLLDQLSAAGVRRAILLTGHRAEDVRQAFGAQYGSLRLEYSRESSPLGTAGAVRQALNLVAKPTMLVLNGDSYCNVDLQAFFEFHRGRRADVSLAIVRVADAGRYGQVRFDAQDRITNFVEKTGTTAAGWISAGIYLIQRELLLGVPKGQAQSLEREWLPRWTASKTVAGFRCPGPFLDIGTPESYAAAQDMFT